MPLCGLCADENINPETGVLEQEKVWGNLGDWLGPEDNKNDKTLMWEAYFLYDLDIMKKVAQILGKKEDAEKFEKLYDERKSFLTVHISTRRRRKRFLREQTSGKGKTGGYTDLVCASFVFRHCESGMERAVCS